MVFEDFLIEMLGITKDFRIVKIYKEETPKRVPNPSQKHLYIKTNNALITNLIIRDLNSKIVKNKIFEDKINTSTLKHGIYFVAVETPFLSRTFKFIKK